jgi:hypothetical protein
MPEPQQETPATVAPQPTPGAVVVASNAPTTPVVSPPIPTATPAPTPQAPEAGPDVSDSAPFAAETPTPEEITESADQNLTWNASEFHAHEKTANWYVLLAMATIAVGAVLYFLTKSIVTPVVVVIGGCMLGVFGTHKPNQIDYGLNSHGLRIGKKEYAYDEFQLFVVTPQSIYPEVTLIPTKRFMPSLSLRYTPEVEDKVLNILADHLPSEVRRLDLVDNLMQHIRF